MELITMLESMDIPENRRDISIESNIKWLIRNLPIRNGNNEFCIDAMRLLVNLLKSKAS